MGKNKKRRAKKNPKSELRRQIEDLTAKCAPLSKQCLNKETRWEKFVSLQASIAQLKAKQTSNTPSLSGDFGAFKQWLLENDGLSEQSKLSFTSTEAEGNGIAAAVDIADSEDVGLIPLNLMISTEGALESSLGPVILQDEFLRAKPSVTLALFLLIERLKGEESFFFPYISILPESFNIPLVWSVEETAALGPSPLQQEAMDCVRNTAQYYCYLQQMMAAAGQRAAIAPAQLTYELFVWAICIVMTRQNNIPVGGANQNALALIPVFDLFNHAPGRLSSFYKPELRALQLTAMAPASAGQQMYIHYGDRSNAELLLYSGFVPPVNAADGTRVAVALPLAHPLHAIRCFLLKKMSLTPARTVLLPQPAAAAAGQLAAQAEAAVFQYELSGDGQPSLPLLATLAVQLMDKAQAGAALKWLQAGGNQVQELLLPYTAQIALALVELLTAKQAEYTPTTTEAKAGEAVAEGAALSTTAQRQLCAQQLLQSECAVLEAGIAVATAVSSGEASFTEMKVGSGAAAQ